LDVLIPSATEKGGAAIVTLSETSYPVPHDIAQPAVSAPPAAFDISDETQTQILALCRMLSDGRRLQILLELARGGEMNVTALCRLLGQSQPAVSHHLALLKAAGLITLRREGKHNFYSVCRRYFEPLWEQLASTVSQRRPARTPAGERTRLPA
jgi:DNA-binding transcriptional ArsR family regulator